MRRRKRILPDLPYPIALSMAWRDAAMVNPQPRSHLQRKDALPLAELSPSGAHAWLCRDSIGGAASFSRRPAIPESRDDAVKAPFSLRFGSRQRTSRMGD